MITAIHNPDAAAVLHADWVAVVLETQTHVRPTISLPAPCWSSGERRDWCRWGWGWRGKEPLPKCRLYGESKALLQDMQCKYAYIVQQAHSPVRSICNSPTLNTAILSFQPQHQSLGHICTEYKPTIFANEKGGEMGILGANFSVITWGRKYTTAVDTDQPQDQNNVAFGHHIPAFLKQYYHCTYMYTQIRPLPSQPLLLLRNSEACDMLWQPHRWGQRSRCMASLVIGEDSSS